MPPVVSKQVANPTRQPRPSPNGSVLSQAVAVEDLGDDYIKIVIYGVNRSGKTTIACEFPKPLLIVSFEPGVNGGSKSVSKIKGVSFIRVETSEQAVRLANELKGGSHEYRTAVVDTVTSCQDMVLRELMGLEVGKEKLQLNWGTVTRDQYRERSEKTREVLRPFRDLPMHVVYTAQEKDHNPPKDEVNPGQVVNKLTRSLQAESFFAADLGAATVKWLHDACDYIGRLYVCKETKTEERTRTIAGKSSTQAVEVETGKMVRRLLTMLQPNYAAGFRSASPEAVPEYVEAKTPKEMYDKVMRVINGTYKVGKETI